MMILDFVNKMGAVATIGMGCMGLFAPNVASRFTGLGATSKTSFAEFRATFGGMFVAMGLVPLLTGSPTAYVVVAIGCFGAALGRLVSTALDRGYVEPKNWGGVVFEAGFGAMLIAGAPLLAIRA